MAPGLSRWGVSDLLRAYIPAGLVFVALAVHGSCQLLLGFSEGTGAILLWMFVDSLAVACLAALLLFGLYKLASPFALRYGRPVLAATVYAAVGCVVALVLPPLMFGFSVRYSLARPVVPVLGMALVVILALRLARGLPESREDRVQSARSAWGFHAKRLRIEAIGMPLLFVLVVLAIAGPYVGSSVDLGLPDRRLLLLVPIVGVLLLGLSASQYRRGGALHTLKTATGAVPLTGAARARVVPMLERLALAVGLGSAVPHAFRIPLPSVNGFVAGPSAGPSIVGLTDGLLAVMTDPELEAVVADLLVRLLEDGVDNCSDVTGKLLRRDEEEPRYAEGFELLLASDTSAARVTQLPESLLGALSTTEGADTSLPGVDPDFLRFLWTWPGRDAGVARRWIRRRGLKAGICAATIDNGSFEAMRAECIRMAAHLGPGRAAGQ